MTVAPLALLVSILHLVVDLKALIPTNLHVPFAPLVCTALKGNHAISAQLEHSVLLDLTSVRHARKGTILALVHHNATHAPPDGGDSGKQA